MVWKNQFIKTCPFTRILETKIYSIIGNDDNLLGQNLIFQPDKIETYCKTKLLKTTEGIFLTNDSVFYRLSVINEKESSFSLKSLWNYIWGKSKN